MNWRRRCLLHRFQRSIGERAYRDSSDRLRGRDRTILQFLAQNHSLSWVLGAQDNQLLFPTTVILTPQYQLANRWVGYLSKDVLGLIR